MVAEGQASADRPQLRLFHYDIKTNRNYGDTLLFECVRQLFQGFGGGRCFRVAESRPLRRPTHATLVDHINTSFDAVLVGGGGLFLRDTNANDRSGWQWDISLEQLRRIEKPIIVFAVGYNRFMDQPDFEPVFRDHVNQVVEQSVFFGLRNHGSIDAIGTYLDEGHIAEVRYQPCPSMFGEFLFPDLALRADPDERRIGAQATIGRREAWAGYDTATVHAQVLGVLGRLRTDGWTVDGVTHVPTDGPFLDALVASDLASSSIRLPVADDPVFGGADYYGTLPFMLGNRGHAEMIPFGMGGLPFAVFTHPKHAYFADDVGRPSWCVDPRDDDFDANLYRTISEAYEARGEHRRHLAAVRGELWQLSLANVAEIYEQLTGRAVQPTFSPYGLRERDLAREAWHESWVRWRDALQADGVAIKLASSERRTKTIEAELTEARQRAAIAEAELVEARARTATAEAERVALAERLAQVPPPWGLRRVRRTARSWAGRNARRARRSVRRLRARIGPLQRSDR